MSLPRERTSNPENSGTGRRAAARAMAENSSHIAVPVLGEITLPSPPEVAYVGGIALLTALEIIEWPVGLALAAGHLMAGNHHNKLVHDFGEALEEA